jgi:hypothetical protein
VEERATVVIAGGGWLTQLADALEDGGVGVVVVSSREAKKLAHGYIRGKGINPKSKRVVVKEMDPLAKLYG